MVRESRDRTGLDVAGNLRYRCRLKALRPAALHSLREEEANRRDQDLVRRHRRAAVVPPWTPLASGCAARVTVMKPAEAGWRDDLTHLGRLNRPVIRGILLESEM